MKNLVRLIVLLAVALTMPARAESPPVAIAYFAGGCFWCIEADFEKLDGVIEVDSGYMGGTLIDPTYQQIGRGDTGHAEAVRVKYRSDKLQYPQLLDYFWRHIDPVARDRQFCDVGPQYRSAIFYVGETERVAALASRDALLASGKFQEIHTEISAAGEFYRAEEYHQDYYKKNPLRYSYYRSGCGRDKRVEQIWGEAH